ncbi:hypothetical protein CR513_25183, partial [Mucuna pruriens]
MDSFDGTQDPHAYLKDFHTQLFSSTFRGVAMQWLLGLPTRTIRTFGDLTILFLSLFATNKAKQLEVADLFNIKQAKGENLKGYLAMFNNATVPVNDSDQKFFIKTFQKGDALALRRLSSMEEIRVRAEKHIKDIRPSLGLTVTRPTSPPESKESLDTAGSLSYPTFRFPTSNVWPTIGADTRGVAHEHTTKDCWTLRAQIERLIQQGYLGCFVQTKREKLPMRQGDPAQASRDLQQIGQSREVHKEKPRERSRSRQHPNTSYRGTITTILGGSATGGRTVSARKKQAMAVLFIQGEPPRVGDPIISFNYDRKGLGRLGEFSQHPLLVNILKVGTPHDQFGGVLGNPIWVCRGTSEDKGDNGARWICQESTQTSYATTYPVAQRRRRLGEEKQKVAKEETNKLITSDFIKELQYPTWLANVVMVRKSNDKWRMCTNYTDLNKTYPKDPYPLPNIN